MGLAVVELVMEIEEEFDLIIPDEDAVALRTVGNVYDYVWRGIKDRALPACQTSRCFHRLRKALGSHFDIPRDRIKPASRIAELIPGDDIRAEWARLSYHAALELPRLRSRWTVLRRRGRHWRIPATCRTVRGLVTSLLPLNHARLSEGFGPWTEAECKMTLRETIARVLEVHSDRVVREAPFINDLGAD